MIILATDPGGILPGTTSGTGYAVLDTESMTILEMIEANHTPTEFVKTLQDLELVYQATLVYEDFRARWGQKFELDSVYLIGALRAEFGEHVPKVLPLAHMSNIPIKLLTKLMKEQGYMVRRGHARMALSVAVYYAAFKLKDQNVLEFLADIN